MSDDIDAWEESEDAPEHPRKAGRAEKRGREGKPLDPAVVKDSVFTYFEARFGLGRAAFEGYGLYLGPKGRVYLGPLHAPSNIRIVSMGLLLARADGGIKPSTNILQLFGARAVRGILSLEPPQTRDFIAGRDFFVSRDQAAQAGDGYVLVRYQDYQLGCGMLKGTSVKNMVPKAKRQELKLF